VFRPEKLFVLRGDDDPDAENWRRMAGGVAGFLGIAVLLTFVSALDILRGNVWLLFIVRFAGRRFDNLPVAIKMTREK
jgi:hypothetical protein